MLEDPPLLVVKRKFKRPDAAKLERLKGAQTGHIVDAMDGRGALDAAIKPLDPAVASFIGVALTCETGPSDNLAIAGAVCLAKAGDVIVAAADAFDRTAVIGDIVTMMAKNADCAGVVIDGMARDLEGIVGVGLPVFARGITPNSCVRSGPGRIGLPIVAGGVAIRSGDVIVADKDGAVVIPADDLDRVIARVDAIRAAEAKTIAKVQTGLTALDQIASLMKSERVKYVD
jgi:4-hydroxy-4-methyl-2-oxoglutarate aldolase